MAILLFLLKILSEQIAMSVKKCIFGAEARQCGIKFHWVEQSRQSKYPGQLSGRRAIGGVAPSIPAGLGNRSPTLGEGRGVSSWFRYFPDNYLWSQAFCLLLNFAPMGGTILWELDQVGKRLIGRQGDAEAWHAEWERMAEYVGDIAG